MSGKNALALLTLFSAFLVFFDLLKLFILNLLESHADTQPAIFLPRVRFETIELRLN